MGSWAAETGPYAEWVELLRLKAVDISAIPIDIGEPMLELSSLLDVLQDSAIGAQLRPHTLAGLVHHLVAAVQVEDVLTQRLQHAVSVCALGLASLDRAAEQMVGASLIGLAAALLRAAHEELASELLPIEKLASDVDDLLRQRSPSRIAAWTMNEPLRMIRLQGDRVVAAAQMLEQVRTMVEGASKEKLRADQLAKLDAALPVYTMSSERLIHSTFLSIARAQAGVSPTAASGPQNATEELQAGQVVLF
ncbi:MAG: hypothetical protein R2729_00175 [Bryobacteraceae bacterium]